MTIFTHFGVAFVLSFLGSIPFGLITLSIADISIRKGLKAGVLFSLGASVFEFIYTFIGLKSIHFFSVNPSIETAMQWIALFVFLGLGFYNFFFKAKVPTKQKEVEEVDHAFFFKGLGIAALNFLIIPYWIFVGVCVEGDGWLILENFWIFIFTLGATLGALVVFFAYAKLSVMVMKKSSKVAGFTNKIIGAVFILLGIYQAVNLF